MKIKPILLLATILTANLSIAAENSRELFDYGWKFTKGEAAGSEQPEFNDKKWEVVNLPHDWSIYGPFSKENAAFSRGAWLPADKCAYRKSFVADNADKDKRFEIYFDGAYRNSEVYINGELLGMRPMGYIAFHYDMTPYIKFGEENVITVKLDNSSQPGSRWYTGTGIYRHVHLIKTPKLYIPVWGNYIVANDFSKCKDEAIISIETTVNNDNDAAAKYDLRYTVIDACGDLVAQQTTESISLESGNSVVNKSDIKISAPTMWSVENPYLYTIKTEILSDGEVVYSESDKSGIRTLEFNHDKGFFLNGESVKLKGVCLHHAGGALGSAIHRRTTERQIEKLKEMGCNSIRTAHNAFSEEFLDVCDSMGMLVMSETFDEWELFKKPTVMIDGVKNNIPVDYYAKQFKEWADRDFTDHMMRDRNHPSIIMWCIGNEIEQLHDESGDAIAFRLAKIVHDLDYRPVTNGAHGYGWNKWPRAESVAASDVYGYNYIKEDGLELERKLSPYKMVVITEHESAQGFYPRGTYFFNKEEEMAWWDKLNYSSEGSYDWVTKKRDYIGTPAIKSWEDIKERDYIMGTYIWTGWDYLGEVIPYGWPARSSSFAPIDLAGFPKDGFYFYQSQWSDKPMVHVFPHWNWEGHEGEQIKISGFTNGDEVELFINGVSQGKKSNNRKGVEYQTWDVTYEPGELKAVSYRNGAMVAQKVINTTGAPAAIRTESRRTEMRKGAQDLIYVECTLVDKDGNEVPTANNMIDFKVSGAATIAGVDNGDNMCHESFKGSSHSAFNGKCLVILQSTMESGDIQLTISSKGLQGSTMKFVTK
ncbi:MAG: glycoside hydrolase family 2 TIM barrel-domain containing protein [Rikenellaceae bacterium]